MHHQIDLGLSTRFHRRRFHIHAVDEQQPADIGAERGLEGQWRQREVAGDAGGEVGRQGDLVHPGGQIAAKLLLL